MDEQKILARSANILREIAPTIPLCDRRLYRLPRFKNLSRDWWVYIGFATVEAHTDKDDAGWVTRGLILINDQNLELFVDDGERSYYPLPVGGVYRVLPQIAHGACSPDHTFTHTIPAEYNQQFFGAVINDYYRIETEPSDAEFRQQALTFLRHWCNEIARLCAATNVHPHSLFEW